MAGRSEPVCQNVFIPGRAAEVGKSQKSTFQATLFLIKSMLIFAIETSCDETYAAVVRDGQAVLSNAISSQIEFHKKCGSSC